MYIGKGGEIIQCKTLKTKLKPTSNEAKYIIILARHSKNLYNQAL